MSDEIPTTHDAFRQWVADNQATWPEHLTKLAGDARRDLWMRENNPPDEIIDRVTQPGLDQFAEAYRIWKTGNGH